MFHPYFSCVYIKTIHSVRQVHVCGIIIKLIKCSNNKPMTYPSFHCTGIVTSIEQIAETRLLNKKEITQNEDNAEE